MKELGADVVYYPELPVGFGYRVVKNLGERIRNQAIRKYYLKILSKIKHQEFDHFLLIKGEMIPPDLLERFKKEHPQTEMVTYQWDSKQNHDYSGIEKYFDRLYSFDWQDCQDNPHINYLPMFYFPIYEDVPRNKIKYDLVFIGTFHGDRYQIIESVLEQAESNGFSFYPYLFITRLGRLRRWLFDKQFRQLGGKLFHTKKLSHHEIAELFSHSKCVLDINSPTQSGITPRSLEALVAGMKLITTNPYIKKEPIFNEDFIRIIDRNDIGREWLGFLSQKIENTREYFQLLKKYSIYQWIRVILKHKP